MQPIRLKTVHVCALAQKGEGLMYMFQARRDFDAGVVVGIYSSRQQVSVFAGPWISLFSVFIK